MPWTNQAVTLIVLNASAGGFSGLFEYSPAPGRNNLIESHAAAQVFDPYGNNVLGGDASYDQFGFACQKFGNGIAILKNASAPAQSGAWNQVAQLSFNEGAGANWWLSPPVLIAIAGASRSTTAAFEVQGTGDAALASLVSTRTAGLITQTLQSGLVGGVPAAGTDATQRNITSAAIVTASNSWSIPANDAKVNSIYRFENTGFFNITNASNAPSWNIKVFGQTFNVFSTSGFPLTQLVYFLEARLSIRATGVTGTAALYTRLSFSVPNTSTNQTWTNAQNTITVDTTSATSMEMDFGFGNITGGPNLVSAESSFEKIG